MIAEAEIGFKQHEPKAGASLVAQIGKECACSAGDPDLIPGSGRSPGERIGYPLQDSGLENSMDCKIGRAHV